MKRFLFPFALPLLFAVCPASGSDPAVAPASTVSSSTNDVKSQLVRYHWQLEDATDVRGKRIGPLFVHANKSLQLDFFADGGVLVRNACNYIGGDYTLAGNTLTVIGGPSTMMACLDPELMALDGEIGRRLEGASQLALLASDTPTLTLTNAAGDKLVLAGKLIGERLTIEVAARTKPCDPASTKGTQCLQVREVKYDDSDGSFDADGPFENLGGEIDGFEHEDGVRYVLGVERFAIEKPPADGPLYRYVLEWTSVKDATGK
jgi:heat shock protein HslJ